MYTNTVNYIKEIWINTDFQKYFKNTSWMFASRILCMIISFVTTVFVARRLGPENLGQLNYAVSFIGIFSFIASLGIDNILYRDLIKYPEKKKEYLGSAITIKLLAGTLTALISILSAIFFTENDVSRIAIFILSGTFIFSAFQIINYEFQSRVKSKYPSIIALLVTIILNSLKIIIVLLGKGVIYLSLVLLFESILYALFYWFFYERKIEEKVLSWKFDKNIAISLLKDSWPLIFTSAFALVYARIDQIFIKHMINAEAVGIYSSAVTLAEVWYFIPTIIVASLFPAIINAKSISEEKYYIIFKKISVLLGLSAIVISLIVTFTATFIMNTVYGVAFTSGSIILKIYVWATIGTFIGYLINNYLIAENNKKGLILITFIPMLINIILNVIWIPKFGIVGAAYATLISYTLGPVSVIFLKKPRNFLLNITPQQK